MDDELENSADQASYLTFLPGARLKKARELRGQAVADVSRELNLPERFILAIEADDYAQLPELAFVRGYLRRYAQLVRLSPDEIVLRFEEHFASRGRVPEAAATGRVNPIQLLGDLHRPRRHWGNLVKWGVAAVLLLLVTVGTVMWRKSATKPQPILAVEAAPVVASAPLAPVPVPANVAAVTPPPQTVAATGPAQLPALPALPEPVAPVGH